MSNTPELTYIGEWVNPDSWAGIARIRYLLV